MIIKSKWVDWVFSQKFCLYGKQIKISRYRTLSCSHPDKINNGSQCMNGVNVMTNQSTIENLDNRADDTDG